MNKKIFIFLLLGFAFRIVISFQNYSGDVTNHMIWGEDAIKNGLPGLYERSFEKAYGHISPNYPPLSILLFAFLYLIKGWIYQFAWFLNLSLPFFPSDFIYFLKDFYYYPYLLKLPAILSDIGIAYVTFIFVKKLVGRKDSSLPLIGSILILFNPAFFYNSAYWGQIDSVPVFFVLSSFYILLFHKKFVLSGIVFTLGILSKQTVVVFFPLFLIVLFRFCGKKTFIKALTVSLIVFWLFFLPFHLRGNLLASPFLTFWDKILFTSGLPYTSNHAFNLWFLLNGSRTILSSSKFIFNISYDSWGYLMTGFIVALVLLKLVKNRFQPKDILYAGFLIPFASFLFLTKMHERHLIVSLPFLLLLTNNSKFLLIPFFYVSLFNFLNMYHNWWSPKIIQLIYLLSFDNLNKVFTLMLIAIFFSLMLHFSFSAGRSKRKAKI